MSFSILNAKMKIKKEKKMTRDFLEDTKETLGNDYLLYLQNRSEEALHFRDKETFDIVNKELLSGLNSLLPSVDGEMKETLEAEIEFVEVQMESDFEDRGSKYLLTDEFLDKLDQDNGNNDAAWQQYIGTRLAEASFENDTANSIFLIGKYRDELLTAYGDEEEMKDTIENFDKLVKDYGKSYTEAAKYAFENIQ